MGSPWALDGTLRENTAYRKVSACQGTSRRQLRRSKVVTGFSLFSRATSVLQRQAKARHYFQPFPDGGGSLEATPNARSWSVLLTSTTTGALDGWGSNTSGREERREPWRGRTRRATKDAFSPPCRVSSESGVVSPNTAPHAPPHPECGSQSPPICAALHGRCDALPRRTGILPPAHECP